MTRQPDIDEDLRWNAQCELGRRGEGVGDMMNEFAKIAESLTDDQNALLPDTHEYGARGWKLGKQSLALQRMGLQMHSSAKLTRKGLELIAQLKEQQNDG